MTEKELMMDDYVEIEGKIDRIACFNPDGWVFLWQSTSYLPVHVDELKPIPLTPEILEKNGFKDMGFFGKLEIGPWRLICDSGNLAVLHEGREEEYINIPISYVHELQHALRLCGIEKEIEI